MCSYIVTRFWCYLDIRLTILTFSQKIWRILTIFVLNHLVKLLRLSEATIAGGYNCRSFLRKKIVLIFKFKSITRFGHEFLPKITDFGVFDEFLVILNLNHLAMLQKWPKSQNYQISQCRHIWMWISPKIPQNHRFWRF